MTTMVAAPNFVLYTFWLDQQPEDLRGEYKYIQRESDLAGWWGPVILIQGGSQDPFIKSLHDHPSRAGRITRVFV